MGLRVRELERWQEMGELGPAWEELVRRGGGDCVFLSQPWLRTWWRCFGEGKRSLFLAVDRGNELVGLAPLMLEPMRLLGRPARRAVFAANTQTTRADVLAAPEDREEVAEALADYLVDEGPEWEVLELGPAPRESGNVEALWRALGERGLKLGEVPSFRSPYATLPGSWEEYAGGRPRAVQRNVSHCRRRLEREGKLRLRMASHGDGVLEQAFAVAEASWQGVLERSLASTPTLRRFYAELWEEAGRQGWRAGGVLEIGGEPAAFLYCLDYHDRVFLLKTGFNPAYRRYSPGVVLLAAVLEEAIRAGRKEADFLGNPEEYKLQWATQLREHGVWIAFSRSLPARAVHLGRFVIRPALARAPGLRRLKRLARVLRGRRTGRGAQR